MNIDLFILSILFIAMIVFCIYSLKKWKKAKYIWLLLIIIVLIIGIIIVYKKTNFHSFSLDTDDKYIVTTNDIEYSYLSDGGTHYNTYYEIDLSENRVEKRQDYVYADVSSFYTIKFLKSYSGKLISEWTLNASQAKQLKTLLEARIQEGDAEEESSEEEVSAQNNTSKSKKDMLMDIADSISSYNNYPWKVSCRNAKDVIMSEEEKNEFLEIIN